MKYFYLPLNKFVISISLLFCVSFSSSLRSQTPVIAFNTLYSGLSAPVDLVNAGDGTNRIFIVQQGGRIRYIRSGVLTDTVFLDVSGIISFGGERGLLSMAFHPGYETNGYFFIYYTALNGDLTLSRYRVSADPNRADAGGQVLLSVQHREFSNHNGGKMLFGSDGHLYLSMGDGGGAGDPHFNGQNGDTLLGKMIRINVDNFATSPPFYTIPSDNPFAANNDNIKNEIWVLGLRNPFRWSFDRLTNDMWIGDVGQSAREEINFRAAGNLGGVNYGWRCYEGNLSYRDSGCLAAGNYVFPIFDYDRTNANGGRSVTGGFVYRGTAYPDLYGWYICIDFYTTNGWLIKPTGSGGWNIRMQSGLPTGIAGFGEGENGELYAASATAGTISQVVVSGILPVRFSSFTVLEKNGFHEISWLTTSEQNLRQFEVQSSIDGNNFQNIGIVMATNTSASASYRYNHPVPANENAWYRLKILDNNGQAEYSGIISLRGQPGIDAVSVYPTIITTGMVNIRLNKPFTNLLLADMNGRIVKTKNLNRITGLVSMDVADLAKGTYILKCSGYGVDVLHKIIIQ